MMGRTASVQSQIFSKLFARERRLRFRRPMCRPGVFGRGQGRAQVYPRSQGAPERGENAETVARLIGDLPRLGEERGIDAFDLILRLRQSWPKRKTGMASPLRPPPQAVKAVRINVTLHADVLARVDAYAAANGYTRSGFLAYAAEKVMAA
jgi:hypothetical protein